MLLYLRLGSLVHVGLKEGTARRLPRTIEETGFGNDETGFGMSALTFTYAEASRKLGYNPKTCCDRNS